MHWAWELFHDFKKQVLTLQPLKIACTVCVATCSTCGVHVMEQFHAILYTRQNGTDHLAEVVYMVLSGSVPFLTVLGQFTSELERFQNRSGP